MDEGRTRAAIRSLVEELYPGASIEAVGHLGCDVSAAGDATAKGIGYGEPVHITLRDQSDEPVDLVLHTATGDEFGHDRRADRAGEMLLAYDTFGSIPRQARAVDVGVIEPTGGLRSLRGCGEFYLITEFAPGALYAEDLRRIARDRHSTEADRRRCNRLALYLAELHSDRGGSPHVYRRAIRDLVGHGEGIYGIVDGYPADVPGAPASRLADIEAACARWRLKLRNHEDRLSRVHGDFHPFNILFDDRGTLQLLDASRGCRGDPVDDVTCLAINFVFFCVGHPDAWASGLGPLWRGFWRTYLDCTGDDELLSVAPPYLAWRVLVLANPRWYPAVSEAERDALLSLVETALRLERFNPETAEGLFP